MIDSSATVLQLSWFPYKITIGLSNVHVGVFLNRLPRNKLLVIRGQFSLFELILFELVDGPP
jgi:hypothetical protein